MKLKTFILGAVLLAMATTEASAQKIHLGVQGGANLSTWTGPDAAAASLSLKPGFVAGAFLQVELGPSFIIQPEILYTQKGSNVTSSGSSSTWDLSYVEIPLLFKICIPTPGFKPNLFAGGAVSFNTVAKATSGGTSVDLSGINSSDFGLIGGVGVDIDKFTMNIRYELGLSDFTTSSVSNVGNGTFTCMVGYMFI